MASAAEFDFKKFSCSSEILFSRFFFFHTGLMVFASNIPKYLLFFFSPRALMLWQFYSFRCFSFTTFHHQHGAFFNTKSHSYISKLVIIVEGDLKNPFSIASLSPSASPCLRDTVSFILPRYQKSCGTSHYTTLPPQKMETPIQTVRIYSHYIGME